LCEQRLLDTSNVFEKETKITEERAKI